MTDVVPQSMTQSAHPVTQNLSIGLLTADLTDRHGWATHSRHLIAALEAAGVRCTVVASRDHADLSERPAYPLLPLVYPPETHMLAKLLRAAPRAAAALRDCDIIHTTVEIYAPLGALIAGQRPFFMTGHGSYVNLPRIRRFPADKVYGWAFRRSTMICVSRYTAKVAERVLPGLRTVVVNNALDGQRWLSIERQRQPGQPPTVLAVGALKRRKGILEIVRAMTTVRERLPDAQCVIIGSLTAMPDYAAEVQAEIARLDLGTSVRLLGHVEEAELQRWYSSADVFVLPSINDHWKFEGYGLVLMEASAAGLPVISTRDCGAEDAVIDGHTGLLLPQDQLETALPTAILSLLTDRDRAAQMGAAGREHARHQTWERVAARMIDIYRAALAR